MVVDEGNQFRQAASMRHRTGFASGSEFGGEVDLLNYSKPPEKSRIDLARM